MPKQRVKADIHQALGGASGGTMVIGATGAGLRVFEGPDIAITGDELQRTIGRAGDHVLLFDSGGATLGEYDTITQALAAATSGDCVQPQAKTYTESFTIPAGVTVRGRGPSTVIVGTVTLGDGAALVACQVLLDVDQAGDAICIVPPSGAGEMAYVGYCWIVANNGNGAGYAAKSYCNHLTLRSCYVRAQSAGIDSNPFGEELYLQGAQVDTFVVPSTDGNTHAGTVPTVSGQWYWIQAHGDIRWAVQEVRRADPIYETQDSWASTSGLSDFLQFNTPVTGSFRDQADPVPDYTATHTYHVIVQGDGNPVSMRSADSIYYDNDGNWTITVYEANLSGSPYTHGCIIPTLDGRAAAIPEYGDRASWRTDYEDGATHADDWVPGDSHHPVVTLGEGSAEELTLDGQELTLAEVLTPTEHTAIGDAAPHHAAVTLGADAGAVLGLTGQQLDLDAQSANAVLAGPASGAAAAPTFRALSNADLPDPLAFKTAASALTIAAGAVTATQNLHTITSETGTADDLATITAAESRTLLLLQATATHTITVKHGTGNISLNGAADFVLSGDKALLLYWNGTAWVDLGAGGAAGALANHDHSGDAGDGGTFDAANLASSAATDGQVLTADGSGGAAWEDAPGSPLTVEEQDGAPSVGSVEKIKVTNGTLTDEGNGVVKLDFGAAATDGSAIHDNVAEEIHAVTEKTAPADNDELLIEDSADSWAKKRVKKSNLGSGDVTWAIIQASQLTNEFKGYPSMVGIDIDLDAANQWWDKEGTPTTAVTMVDVAGEAGLTETYEYALKTVTDAASEGLSQTWTYADEPRVKSGRKLSAICAIWSVSNLSVTAKLVNSDASETAASAVTAAAWTIVKVENHTLAGSSCKFQVTAAGAGTFYVVPLGACIGQKAVPLGPRGLRYCQSNYTNLAVNVDTGGEWLDLDITASASALAAVCLVQTAYNANAYKWIALRRKGSDYTAEWPTAVVLNPSTSQYSGNQGLVILDDANIFQYCGSNIAANTEHAFIFLVAWGEWE